MLKMCNYTKKYVIIIKMCNYNKNGIKNYNFYLDFLMMRLFLCSEMTAFGTENEGISSCVDSSKTREGDQMHDVNSSGRRIDSRVCPRGPRSDRKSVVESPESYQASKRYICSEKYYKEEIQKRKTECEKVEKLVKNWLI